MRILLLAADGEYGRALVQGITSIRKGIHIMLADIQSWKKPWMENPHLVMVEEHPSETRAKEISDYFSCSVLFLVEDSPSASPASAYKYGSVKEIIRRGLAEAVRTDLLHPSWTEEKETPLLVVTGARGGTGKTAISLGIASELKIFHDCRTLYLNGGVVDLTEDWHPRQDEKSLGSGGMDQYLYYRESRGAAAVEDYLQETSRGVHYFSPSKRRNPLMELSSEEQCQLIGEIRHNRTLDWLIIDLPSPFSEGSSTILKEAKAICYVSDQPLNGDGERENKRDREMIRLLSKISDAPFCYIQNQRFPSKFEGKNEGEPPDDTMKTVEIDFDPELAEWKGSAALFPMSGIFARRMREIGQWIMEFSDPI